MENWSDSGNEKPEYESITYAMCELLREAPDDAVYGMVNGLTSVFEIPTFVLSRARRGLRDLRPELEKWKTTPIEEEPF